MNTFRIEPCKGFLDQLWAQGGSFDRPATSAAHEVELNVDIFRRAVCEGFGTPPDQAIVQASLQRADAGHSSSLDNVNRLANCLSPLNLGSSKRTITATIQTLLLLVAVLVAVGILARCLNVAPSILLLVAGLSTLSFATNTRARSSTL